MFVWLPMALLIKDKRLMAHVWCLVQVLTAATVTTITTATVQPSEAVTSQLLTVKRNSLAIASFHQLPNELEKLANIEHTAEYAEEEHEVEENRLLLGTGWEAIDNVGAWLLLAFVDGGHLESEQMPLEVQEAELEIEADKGGDLKLAYSH